MAKIKVFETEGNRRDQNSQQLEFLSCQLFLVSDGTGEFPEASDILPESSKQNYAGFLESRCKQEGDLAFPKTKRRGGRSV